MLGCAKQLWVTLDHSELRWGRYGPRWVSLDHAKHPQATLSHSKPPCTTLGHYGPRCATEGHDGIELPITDVMDGLWIVPLHHCERSCFVVR